MPQYTVAHCHETVRLKSTGRAAVQGRCRKVNINRWIQKQRNREKVTKTKNEKHITQHTPGTGKYDNTHIRLLYQHTTANTRRM